MIDRRLTPRFALGLACSIRKRGDANRAAQLIDVSQSGCRIETLCRLHAGEQVWMTIGTVRSVPGSVVWASGDFAGIAFNDPLHLGVVDDLIIRVGGDTVEVGRLHDIAQRSEWQASRTSSAAEADQLLDLARGCARGRPPPAAALTGPVPSLHMEP